VVTQWAETSTTDEGATEPVTVKAVLEWYNMNDICGSNPVQLPSDEQYMYSKYAVSAGQQLSDVASAQYLSAEFAHTPVRHTPPL